jgi:hypothetical protein
MLIVFLVEHMNALDRVKIQTLLAGAPTLDRSGTLVTLMLANAPRKPNVTASRGTP